MAVIYLCGAMRGRYSPPIPIKGSKIKAPKILKCEYPKHEGRRKWFPSDEMYIQEWQLTDEEFRDAVKNFDVFSLTKEIRVICKDCAKLEDR